MKIIAFYLPQFHAIPENDEWWGKGFTEWVNMKKAKPLFKGHYQPRIPENSNYYNLLDDTVKEKQVKLAKENGVYGFCFYHYWFDGHMLLEKPVEQYLKDEKCDLPFCICWANEAWTNQWVSAQSKVLIEQKYGGEKEWEEHYYYLRNFFLDSRYIKEDNKPFVVIYRPELIECRDAMLRCWDELAKKDGFDGLEFAFQAKNYDRIRDKADKTFKYAIEYQPFYAFHDLKEQDSSVVKNKLRDIKFGMELFAEKKLGIAKASKHSGDQKEPLKFDYDAVWEQIIKRNPPSDMYIPGAFVDWDNTPRKGVRGSVMIGSNPDKFEAYMEKQIIRAKNVYHKDMIFMFAWNEWAEGGYLEPDEFYGDAYLKAIKKALEKTGEFPVYDE